MARSGPARAWSASAPVFAALGDETRLRVIGRLCEEGPLSITRLTAGTRVSRQAVTKHLLVLARAGLVRGEREGRERVWRVEGRGLAEAHRLLGLIASEWDDALERLRAHLEG